MKSQIRLLSNITSLDPAGDDTVLTELPTCPPPAAYEALTKLFESSQIASESPFGARAHTFALKTRRELREAMKLRDSLISERIDAAFTKFAEPSSSKSDNIRSAVEIVVEREIAAATKAGRKPMQPSVRKYAHDELCFFLFAGSTTTAEVVGWAFKYLTAYQDVQTKLRKSVKAAFRESVQGGAQPTVEAIVKAKNPYLEAFVHETLRHGTNIANHVRTALVDTEILGHRIPKGTEVFLVVGRPIPEHTCEPADRIIQTRGPSFHSPAMQIDESRRSMTSQASSKESIAKWDQSELEKYDPERWLRYCENGMEFDPKAAPMQTFGEGPRSCFGRSLAMLEMRIIYTLVVWNFELLQIAPSLMDFKPLELLTLQPDNVRVKLTEITHEALKN